MNVSFQSYHRGGKTIWLDPRRDDLLTDFGKSLLDLSYCLPGENYQELFGRVSCAYGDDEEHAQRLYDAMSRLWFMPSTPVLSNGGNTRGLPISCFLNEAEDNLESILEIFQENGSLGARGGGVGTYWGHIRPLGDTIGLNTGASGAIPFIKVMESLTLAIGQGSLRRGAGAAYMPLSHPEIMDFINMRRPTGGDPNRKALYLHHGVTISDEFMKAVDNKDMWDLINPHTGAVVEQVSARSLWIHLLTTRLETGEPYFLFTDTVARQQPSHHQKAGLKVRCSNLCNEITLPTGKDPWGQRRTAVCCLSSLNLATYPVWEPVMGQLVTDVLRFLDNILEDFIARGGKPLQAAVYAAQRERSVGLGVMGYHTLFQSKGWSLSDPEGHAWNKVFFARLRQCANQTSKDMATEKGSCLDAAAYGVHERFSHKLAIAPTATISIICGGVSPGIDPIYSNAYLHKTKSGSIMVRNQALAQLLREKDCDTDEVWSSIVQNEGSVQHVMCLTEEQKKRFATAFEIDQFSLVAMAGDRASFVCQSQSLNFFLRSDVKAQILHQLHREVWARGCKGAYYCRTRSPQRGENMASAQKFQKMMAAQNTDPKPDDLEECLMCT